MQFKSKHLTPFLACLIFIMSIGYGQDAGNFQLPSDYEKTILKLDSLFWKSYNSCDLEKFQTFLTDDLEFYHDKGGLTVTSTKLLDQVTNGLCGDENVRLRREAIKGSVQIFPLNKYGAIITGTHVFYLNEKNKPEKLIEKAKFTHVWKLENNQWKMSRVLSYDHQQVSVNSNKPALKLSKETLLEFVGKYQAPNTGLVTISLSPKNVLLMDAGQMKAQLHPEAETLFFIKEAPITFEFIKSNSGQVVKFIVRESGKVVEEAERTN